jgi:hypothetical protein
MWTNGWPNLVRPDLWDNKAGKVENIWNANGAFIEGLYFGDRFIKVLDRNICDPTKMTATLYTANCEFLVGDRMMLRGNAPRALALNSGAFDRFGEPTP